MKPFSVSFEKTDDKKHSVRYDSPTKNDYVTNVYISNDAFNGSVPKTITALYFEGQLTDAQIEAAKAALGLAGE